MPSASVAPGAPLERPAPRWTTAGLVLLGVWSALLAAAVALWVFAAFLSGSAGGDRGLVRLVGAPFVLVAVALLWWAWRSARALRRGRREGWTLLLVLGAVAVLQAVLTTRAVLASSGTSGTSSPSGTSGAASAGGSGLPPEVAAGLLAAIVLGLVSVTVALLARRAWAAAADNADNAADDTEAEGAPT
jgi:hypothetical protein